MFISADEKIMGVGDRVQAQGRENTGLRIIEKAAGCTNFEKVACGKYTRFILTKAGQLFCSGLNKHNALGFKAPAPVRSFTRVTENFPVENHDKIVDVASGDNFTLIATRNGNVYGAGQQFYTKASLGTGDGDAKSRPYELTLPQDYRALKVFCAQHQPIGFVLAEQGQGGSKSVLSIGIHSPLLGEDKKEVDASEKFHFVTLPAGLYFNDIQCAGENAWAID